MQGLSVKPQLDRCPEARGTEWGPEGVPAGICR